MSTYKPQKPTFAFSTEEVDANPYEMATASTTPQSNGEVDKELLERLKTESALRELSLGMPIDRTRDMLRKKGVNPVSTEYVKEAGARAMKVREYFKNADKPINEEGYIDLSQPTSNIAGFDKYVDTLITAGLAEEQTDAGGKRIGITLTSKGDIEPLIAGVFSSTPTPEAFSGRSQSDYFSQLTKEVISRLPVNKNGEIEYDGVPYQWAELYDAFYPVVAERAHKALLDNNKDYFNWSFEQSMGMSYEDWYKGYANQRVSEIEQKVIELRDAVAEEAAQIAEGRGREVALSSGTLVPASVLGWASKEGARIEASKQFNDVLESINTFRNNGFVAGFDEGFDWVDALSFGLADLGTSYSQLQLLEKAKRGEELSNSESKVLELLQLTQEFEGIKKNLGREKSLGSVVGSGLGTTLSMAPSFAAGMAATSRIGTTVKLLSNVAKNTSKKAAVKQIGKNLITSYARGAAVAPFMPSTYTTGLKELQEQYTFNADGSIKFEPTNKALAFMGGYIDTMNEYASEVFGSTLGEILGYGARAFGRVTRLNKAVDAMMDPINAGLGKAIDKALSYLPIEDAAKLAGVRKALRGVIVPSAELDEETKELMRLWGVQDGYVAEAGSEVFGDLMSQVMRDIVGAKTDYSDFTDSNFWTSQLLVAVLYGGSMNALGHIKEGVSDYQQMVDLGKHNKKILDSIENRELRNKVLAAVADGNIEQMSRELADIDWENGNYHPTDRPKVMDYVRNEMMIQTIAGKVEDGGRVDAFAKEVAKLSGVTYQGKGGLIMETTVGGRQYYIVDGKPADRSESSMLTCIDKETGEKKAILANTLPEQPSIRTFNEVAEQMYVSQFSAQAEATRLSALQSAYDQMERPTAEIARDIMSRMGITPPAEGDIITLADGRKARVTQDLENGEYVVRLEDKVPLLFTVPFYSIQSSNPLTAEAQKLMIEGKVGSTANKASDVAAMEVENGDVTEETMAQPTEGVTPAETSEAEAQTAEAMAQTEELVANDTLDMTNVPTDADGDVDYDAIDDPVQYGQVYAHEAGGKAQARAEVEELKQKTLEAAAKLEEQSKNEITASAKRKKLKEAKKLRERAAFYDNVLSELEEMEEEYTSVVKNEYSQQVAEPTLRVLDAMARKLGIKVRFVDEVNEGKANAQITKDGYVEIAFNHRDKSVTFLMGHEFTHRMQDLSPEQYAEFKQMVKDFVGEEAWNNESNLLKTIYAIQGIAIEDAELEDEITADMAGALVEQRDAFLDFLEGKKDDKTFLGKVMDFLKEMAAIFNGANDNDREKQVLNLIDGVNRLIESAERANAQGIKPTSAETSARHSIIGEVGATALDIAEEATLRMDNLAIARQMEERGDSALDIRMATGWERGADGLWRYEVMDAEVNLYDGNEATIRKQIAVAEEEEKDFMQQSKVDTKELRERTNAYLAEMREKYGVAEGEETDAMTEEEIAHLQSLTGKEIAFEEYKERRRSELYNRRMALEAQLGYVKVKNTDSDAMIQTTRLGHILQGKNADALFTAYPWLRDMEVQFVTDIRDGAFAAYATKGGYKRIELNAKKTPVDMLTYYLMHEVQHAIQDVEGFAGGGNLSSLQNNGEVTAKEAYDYYRKIAGEVEARNVSARLNMSAEERMNTLLSETEDVAREDQIFLRDGVEMAMAKRESLPKEEYAKLASIIMTRQHTYGKPSFDYAFTSDNFYIYDYLGDGDSIINFAMPIIGNEELIKNITTSIDNGTITSSGSLDTYVKEVQLGKRGDINYNTNAFKKYKRYRGVHIHIPSSTDNYSRGVSEAGGIDSGRSAHRGESGNSNESGNQELDYRYSLRETDPEVLDKLNNGKTIKVYRAMQVIDGKLYPPMSARVGGKLRAPIAINEWERAEERPDLADDKGYFKLDKGNSTSLKARYNPYIHTSLTPLNDQFSSAQDRPNLVTVEVEIPESELTSGYKAEKAKDAVGKLEWKAGVVQSQLTGTRTVILSRWDRPLRIVPDSEVAQRIVEMFGDTKVVMPSNVVTPSLRKELEKLGVEFRETDNQGKPRYSLITPEMDAAYLSAVERGDMETAQQMVMEAAKLAMPNTKVVDENGNPKVVYHGSNAQFTVFDAEKIGSSTGTADGRGFYFTTSKDYAQGFATTEGKIFGVFLNIENPLSYDRKTITKAQLKKIFKEADEVEFESEGEHYMLSNYADYTAVGIQGAINEGANLEYDYADNDVDLIGSIIAGSGSFELIMNAVQKVTGKSSMIAPKANNTTHYIVTDPKLIKSADPVTYDDNGNVIPLSERFNPEKEDIRYSLTAYNGDIERILSDSKAIAKTYAISSDVIVAKSEQDYITALLAYGVPEDKIYSDTDAVYLDWEDVIVVNAQGINTPIRLTEVLNHENMHSISHQNKEGITKVAGTLPILKVVEYASNELGYSLDYIKKHFADIPLEVVDEILSTFVESISTMPVVGGGYVLRRYLMGNLTIEDALEASKQIIKGKYGSKYSELTAATMPLLQDNLIKLRDERYKEGKVGNTTVWSEGSVTNGGGFAETGRSEEESRAESQTAQRDGRTEAESTGGEGGEVGRFSISTDMTEEDAYKASLLEEAMRMEREATSNGMDIAQEIADATGWVRLANGKWRYYGEGKLDITDKASAERAAFRWLEAKKAVKKARVRKTYAPIINEIIRDEWSNNKEAFKKARMEKRPMPLSEEAKTEIARLEYERDAALAQIDAEYKDIFEDFNNNPDTYVREHQEAESYNADLDMYVGSLGKARKEVERMERDAKKRKLSDEEKMAAMRATKSAIAKELRDGLGRFTRKYDIQRMMDAVNDARTPYAMLRAIDKAMESLFEIKWRKEFARMQMLTKSKLSYGVTAIDASSFLNTFVSDHKITAADARKIMNDYWRGTKANGVSVAKYIDDTTRQAMEFISEMAEYDKARARFSDIKATEIIAFTRKLREKLEDYTSLNDYKLKTALANDAVREAVIDAVDILEMYWKAQELQLSLNDDKHRRDISALEIKAKEITAQLREVNQQIKDLADGKVVVTASGVKDRDLLRKELQERYNTLLAERAEAYADMYNAMPDIINLMQEANRAVETLLRTGKVNLAIERTKRKEHEKEIIDDVLADLASPASAHKNEIDLRNKNVFERIATGVGSTIGEPLGSMDYMLRAIGRNAPLGEGRTYNRFAYAFQKAYDNIYTALEARKKMLDDKCNILWGENYHEVHKMAESTKVMTHTYSSAINTKDGGWKPVENTTDIYVTQAMYILATWNQAEGRVTMERQGFTDESINAIRDALNRIDPRWIEFADWVVEEYLPSGRERYNAVHRDIFGTSMAAVPNYFPIKRAKEKLQKEEDVAKGDVDLLPSTVVGAIKERTSNVVPIDIETSFFEALNENTSVMEAWAEMAGLIQDINTILSNGAVQKTMLDINSSLFSDFKKAAQVATLSYIGKTPDIDKNLGTILNRLWAGSKIAFRLNTAFKQLSSALLFAGYSADPKFQAILLWRYLGGVGKMPVALMNGIIDGASYLSGHSFANIDIMTNIEWAKKNMPSFAKRWNEGVAGNELMARTTSGSTSWKQRAWYVKFDDAMRAVTKFGMKPNAFIDAFTSAAGARAVYDYTYEEMRKEGYSEEDAHTLAIINAEMAFNTTQQSSEGLYLAPAQVDRSVVATALSTFMNAPYAMFRNTMIGMKEIFRDAKKELAEIERLEFKRAMDIAKKQVEAQVAAAVARGEYSEEEAKKRRDELFDSAKAKIIPLVKDRAYNKYVKAQTKAVVMVFLNGYAGTAAFILMGRLPELLFGDDDEEKKKAVYDIVVHSAWEAPLSMIPVGGNIISLVKGYDASLLPAVDELTKEGKTIIKRLREEGISPEAVYTATKMCMRWGLGLNVDTIANIALGLENMIEDGMSPEAILKVMNAPEGQIRSIVSQRREGETAKEYSERVMRFYSFLDTPIYEDYFHIMGDDIGERKNNDTPRGMSNKEMRRISFEDAYRRNVILRYGGGKQLAEMQETRKAYNKLKREGYGNIIGSPRDYLKNLTTKRNKAEAALIRFVGADAAYYDMLQVVDEYEKLYIELYEQFKQ